MMKTTPDMLVKLYRLPHLDAALAIPASKGIAIRKAYVPEKMVVVDWVREHFGSNWACEVEHAFCATPPTVYIAVRGETLLGFACYDTTFKNYFGPTGVDKRERGAGIGKGLLLASLHSMFEAGYRYAIIGYAGVPEYYEKLLGAIAVDDDPRNGSYSGLIV